MQIWVYLSNMNEYMGPCFVIKDIISEKNHNKLVADFFCFVKAIS